MTKIAISACLGFLAPNITAPIAVAAPPDEAAFLFSIRQSGVTAGDSQVDLQLGYLVCAGYTSRQLADDRLVSLLDSQPWSYPQKVTFISAAKSSLCP
jgi:hypothetical protein